MVDLKGLHCSNRGTPHSPIWKSIVTSFDLIRRDFSWHIGNGEYCRFWLDKWSGETTLVELCTLQPPQELLARTVHDYWQGTGWCEAELQPYLPPDMFHSLRLFLLADTTPDKPHWNFTSNGQVTTKSAYAALTMLSIPSSRLPRRKLWNFASPSRASLSLYGWWVMGDYRPTSSFGKGNSWLTQPVRYVDSTWRTPFMQQGIALDPGRFGNVSFLPILLTLFGAGLALLELRCSGNPDDRDAALALHISTNDPRSLALQEEGAL